MPEKEYKFRCTKETPWDKKTKPVLHVDGDFVDMPFMDNILHCPNCGHTWSIGPDYSPDDPRFKDPPWEAPT